MVRAKFRYVSYTTTMQMIQVGGRGVADDPFRYENMEVRTMKFSPVYGNGDPNHENTKFWRATPSGSLELGTVNKEAWEQFELGKEYYLDFSPAP